MAITLNPRDLYSGVVISFCLTFICFLPVTLPLLAKFGIPIMLTEQSVTLFLRVFLVMSGMGFIWSYRLQRNLLHAGVGLISLILVFIGHEVIVSPVIFYLGIIGLVIGSLLKSNITLIDLFLQTRR